MAAGSSLFELLVLSLVGRIGQETTGGVALSLGLAATVATIALCLMLLTRIRLAGWLLTAVLGLWLVPWLLRGLSGPLVQDTRTRGRRPSRGADTDGESRAFERLGGTASN